MEGESSWSNKKASYRLSGKSAKTYVRGYREAKRVKQVVATLYLFKAGLVEISEPICHAP